MKQLCTLLTWLALAAASCAESAIPADLAKGAPHFDANGRQIGWTANDGAYFAYDAASDNFSASSAPRVDFGCLAEVNALRAARGLRPFLHDSGLTQAAQAAASWRAANHVQGHASNDFSFLPPGASATAAGCAANGPEWGFMACCVYDGYTWAGAASVVGADGRRYCHLFVR